MKRGESLSAAFEAQSGFPLMYTTTLLAGERSGNLPEVLERYVSFQKVSLAFRKKLIASLIYPSLLMTLVIGLMIFLLAVVVPQFAVLYDQMGSKLPTMTLDLLAFGKWLQHNILWIVLIAAMVGASALPLLAHRARPRFCGRLPRAGCRSSARSGSSTRWRCFRARSRRC